MREHTYYMREHTCVNMKTGHTMEHPFTPEERAAWNGFLEIYALMWRTIEKDLQQRGHISHVEFEIILRLWRAEHQRMRIQDIVAQSILSQSGVSRAIARLVKEGLVRREGAENDRRGTYAVLTVAGVARFDAVAQPHINVVRENFLNHCSTEELRIMAMCWERMRH